MKMKTETLLKILNVFAWIAFIGLMVKAGAILTSYGISVVNEVAAKNLYNGLDLSFFRKFGFGPYTRVVSLMFAIPALQAYTAYLVVKVLSTIKMTNPFTIEIAKIIEKISYCIFTIWLLVISYNVYVGWLMKGIYEDLLSENFIFFAGVVFVFAQIFKRGVEIQSENDLTV